MRQRGFLKFFIMALFLVAAIAFSVSPSEAKKGKKGHKDHKNNDHGLSAALKAVDHVVVSFTGFVVKTKSGEVIDVDYGSAREIDLMDLPDNVGALIFDDPLPEGKYRGVMLKVKADKYVIDSYIEISGERHPLWIPSGKRTGLKLIKGFKVSASGEADFGIKFHLRKSVRPPRGENGHYILRPTLKIKHNHDDDDDGSDVDVVVNAVPGSINGTVTTSLLSSWVWTCAIDPEVYLFEGLSITPDDQDANEPNPVLRAFVIFDTSLPAYAYNFGSVAPGEYTLAFSCQAKFDNPDTDDSILFTAGGDVTVTSGEASVVNF